jgi:hypothetical protein
MRMSVSGALRGALQDFYAHSWRFVVLNGALALGAIAVFTAGAFFWPALVLVLMLGPLAAALMHCAVTLVREGDISLACATAGVRLHWRRGLELAGFTVLVVIAGLAAVQSYGGAGELVWPFAFLSVYVLALFLVYELVLWPLAIAERELPFRQVLRHALRVLVARPRAALGLGLVLLLVNVLGAAAALMPLLTLTIAYSFLAAARFALPPPPPLEARS